MEEIFFAKSDDRAIVPSKRAEDGGYDIYAVYDEPYVVMHPGAIHIFKTGLHSAFSPDYRIVLKERGSTGSKGMAVRAGIIDSGYRDEWLVILCNTSNNVIVVTDNIKEVPEIKFYMDRVVVYPKNKAICQALVEESKDFKVVAKSLEDLMSITSERGLGKLGSSGK